MNRGPDIRPSLTTRVVAALAAALLMVLTVLTASPELHERLHGHPIGPVAASHAGTQHSGSATQADDEDGCVVTLFAQGVVLAFACYVLAAALGALSPVDFAQADRVAPDAPRYLRHPAHAPPAGLS
jgi:hypothetical protein